MTAKEEARRKIYDLLREARQCATGAGLTLEIESQIKDPEQERLQEKLQVHLVAARENICSAIECADELGMSRIDFLGGFVMWKYDGEKAHGGPKVFGEEWRSSNFECYPTDSDWEWLYGPNAPPKPYDGF